MNKFMINNERLPKKTCARVQQILLLSQDLTIYFIFSALMDMYLKGIHRMNSFKNVVFKI